MDYRTLFWRYRYMTELTPAQIAYMASQRLGRIATSGADHKPHVVPTSYHYNPELGTIDMGSHHVATTKKFRDVQANGWEALVIDDLVSTDPWTPRMLKIRGRAEPVATGGSALGPGFGEAFIRISPEKVNSFSVDERLQHVGDGGSDDVDVAAGADRIEKLGQVRLDKGHQGASFDVLVVLHTEDHPMSPPQWWIPASTPSGGTSTLDRFADKRPGWWFALW